MWDELVPLRQSSEDTYHHNQCINGTVRDELKWCGASTCAAAASILCKGNRLLGMFQSQRATLMNKSSSHREEDREGLLLPTEIVISPPVNHLRNGIEKQNVPGPFGGLRGILPPIPTDWKTSH